MKKNVLLLSIILVIVFLPFVVSAKNYCKVVSGNGKDIGSEIACGSEHFYIIDSSNEKTKMLAKYNLFTGISIFKEKIEKEEGDTRTDYEYCDDLAISRGGLVKSDDFYNDPGYCYYVINHQSHSIPIVKETNDSRSNEEYCSDEVNKINNADFITISEDSYDNTYYCIYRDKVLQSEDAKSAHWDEDLNYLYPQVGDVYLSEGEPQNTSQDSIQGNTNFYDYEIYLPDYWDGYEVFKNYNSNMYPAGLEGPLYFYRKELTNMGYSVNNMTILSLSELDSIANKLSNKSLPLRRWGEEVEVVQSSGSSATLVKFGDLKQYIPKEYAWLYSTTYWNRSIYKTLEPYTYRGVYHVFVAQQGKLCGAGFQVCAPETALGCGVRPVITIPTNELEFLISTKTDGNGDIEVIDKSLGGKQISFKVKAKNGYKLDKLIITTDSGETVEFEEGEIIENEDGTISIDNSKFTMPFENVTIEAKWSSINSISNILTNPKTGNKALFIVSFMIVCIGTGTIMIKKYKH